MAIPNRGPELFAVNVAFLVVTAISVSLRIFVRLRMLRAWGTDDWLMMIAMASSIEIRPRATETDDLRQLFYIGYITSSNIGVHYGTGRHHHDLSEHGVAVAKHCW